MKIFNYGKQEESTERRRIVPGGYVCRIVSVDDNEDKEYLKVYFDIIEGKYQYIGRECEDRTGQTWGYLSSYRSYKQTALGMFAAFLGTLERSNQGRFVKDTFTGEADQVQRLVGLKIGLVVGEEEYQKRDGTIGKRIVVDKLKTVDQIHSGDFTVPELKRMKPSAVVTTGTDVTAEEEIPF